MANTIVTVCIVKSIVTIPVEQSIVRIHIPITTEADNGAQERQTYPYLFVIP